MFNREEAIKELCQTKGLFVCGESLCNMCDEDIEAILGFVRRAKARDEEAVGQQYEVTCAKCSATKVYKVKPNYCAIRGTKVPSN